MEGETLRKWVELTGFSPAHVADYIGITSQEMQTEFDSERVSMGIIAKVVDSGLVDVYVENEYRFKQELLANLQKDIRVKTKT